MSIIGVIGGSGFYSLFEKAEEINSETPYGWPSSKITIGEVEGKKVAFLARHGPGHIYPAPDVPYKANIQALYDQDVRQIIAATAVGSLKKHIKPGDIVVPDQFVNLTQGRDNTFYHGPETVHISAAEPYCPVLRNLVIEAANELNMRVHPVGTVVTIRGPGFSSRAESNLYRSQGWDIVGMTQYPEVVLAREREMCYANIALVTDYDAGLHDDPSISAVTAGEVKRVMDANAARLRMLIKGLVPHMPVDRDCSCARALEGAKLSK